MHADVIGAFTEMINGGHVPFQHKGKNMSRDQIIAVLGYAIFKGYEKTNELSDDEVDRVITNLKDSL